MWKMLSNKSRQTASFGPGASGEQSTVFYIRHSLKYCAKLQLNSSSSVQSLPSPSSGPPAELMTHLLFHSLVMPPQIFETRLMKCSLLKRVIFLIMSKNLMLSLTLLDQLVQMSFCVSILLQQLSQLALSALGPNFVKFLTQYA